MAIKLHFNESDIYQKQFKTRLNGYDPKEVNSFLDLVMVDYQTMKQAITKLQQHCDYLQYHLNPLRQKITNMKTAELKKQTDVGLRNHAFQVKIQKNQNKINNLTKQLHTYHQHMITCRNNFNQKLQAVNNKGYLSKLAKKLISKHTIYTEYPWKNPKNTLKILERLENLENSLK